MLKKKHKLNGITTFDVINYSLVILITILIAYPLYFCVIASFSSNQEIALGNTLLWVKGFTLEAYENALSEARIWTGYRNTIIYTVLGTLYNLVLTIPLAYVLSKNHLPFRRAINMFFFITMYISGGIVPTYFLLKSLGLINNPLVMIVGSGVSCYNMIVTRSFFSSSIPEELYDAAYIDGASEMKTFTSIAMPLSKPIIAVMALYYGVGHWDSYFSAMMYLQKNAYKPLQLILREILLLSSKVSLSDFEDADYLEALMHQLDVAATMKYAVIFIASLPLLIVYPFIQKYFAKGVMIGAVKG